MSTAWEFMLRMPALEMFLPETTAPVIDIGQQAQTTVPPTTAAPVTEAPTESTEPEPTEAPEQEVVD